MKLGFKLEEIKYAKISYKDDSDNLCSKKIAIRSINEKEIFASVKITEDIFFEDIKEVVLDIVCNDGLYTAKTTLKRPQKDEPYIFFTLDLPSMFEYRQNREFFRVRAKFECVLKVYKNYNITEINGYTYDISANGVSVVLENLIIPDEDSDITIAINGKLISSKVSYVRSEKLETGHKISFYFVKISNPDRDYISQVCLQKQLEEKRNFLK